MDPMFMNMGIQAPPPSLNLGAVTAASTLPHLNGLPQESKLASYISNRQQQSGPGSLLPQSSVSTAPLSKSLAALTLDMNKKVLNSNLGTDFLSTSTSVGSVSGLAHSSSTPSFHSFTSSGNPLNNHTFSSSNNHSGNNNPLAAHNSSNTILSSQNSHNSSALSAALNSNNSNPLGSLSSSSNPLAAHNFPALSSASFAAAAAAPATTLQYSAALSHRASPASTASPRPPSPSSLQPHHAGSPERIPRPPSPSDQSTVSTFQEHIGGTTYFYSAQELAALTASSGGASNGAGSGLPSVGGAVGLSSSGSSSHQAGVGGNGSSGGSGDGHALLALPTFNVAPPTPAHIHHLRTPTSAPHFFVQDELRRQLLEKQTLAMAQLTPDQYPDLPREVDFYQELVPQDNPHAQLKSTMFGYPTSVYKATHSKTGVQYCLYRVHGYRLNNVKVTQIVDLWKKLQHSAFVQLREVFTTKVFGDNSIIFVFDYHPGAETLCSRFSTNAPLQPGWETVVLPPPTVSYTAENAHQALISGAAGAGREMVSEAVLWNIVIQLTGALRTIHAGGLACRMLDPSKVLLTDNLNRLRINCCGILDVLNFDPNTANPMAAVPHNQQEDLVQLGKLLLGVSLRACVAGVGIQRDKMQSALDLIQRTYSRDLSMLIMCLLTQHRIKNINDVMPMIGARFYTAVECATQRSDLCESELAKELHNGRLFRLITKLSTIVDRPHVNNDANWCETGDRYMLKLFRDYLFYQTHEDGRPWLDLGHIVSVLNKIDSGSPDQLVLMSHDGQNVLVTSYHELKTCFARSFNELLQASSTAPSHKLS